jgi:hypothetical protein
MNMEPAVFIDRHFRHINNPTYPIRIETGWLLEWFAAYEIIANVDRSGFGVVVVDTNPVTFETYSRINLYRFFSLLKDAQEYLDELRDMWKELRDMWKDETQ